MKSIIIQLLSLALLGLLIGLLLELSIPDRAAAQTYGSGEMDDPVKAVFIADVTQISPGQTFRIGIKLEMNRDSYIYWRHPGNYGKPTLVMLDLPTGFVGSSIRYPIPHQFAHEDQSTGIGYRKQVLLSAQVTAPKDLRVGTTISIKALAQWFAYTELPILGRMQLHLSLPVASQGIVDKVKTKLFDANDKTLPIDYRVKQSPITKITTSEAVSSDVIQLATKVHWNTTVKEVQFFPVPDRSLIIKDWHVAHYDNVSTITFAMQFVPDNMKRTGPMTAMMVYTDEKGKQRGVYIDVPVPARTDQQ